LLCGYQPFRSDDPNEVAKETMRGKIEFHERYWKNVSEEGGSPVVPCSQSIMSRELAEANHCRLDSVAKDFIKELIVLDPAQRLTADAAFQHPVRRCNIRLVLTIVD
jgi:calcium/calmodulin-dependent protein kinase I